jgi:pyruvate kinase
MSITKEKIEKTIQKISAVFEIEKSLRHTYREDLSRIHPAHQLSADNLLVYLALRHLDLEEIQDFLGTLGLSRLAKAEGHVKSSLESVIHNLKKLIDPEYLFEPPPEENFREGFQVQKLNSTALLGPEIAGRMTRIMVTLPSEAAFDYQLVYDLLQADINCFRINCAHDDPDHWKRMIDLIQRAREETGKDCRICMDLSGPKFRTGPMRPGPKVLKIRPEKNDYGIVVNPVKFWIAPREMKPEEETTLHVPVGRDWFEKLEKGSVIQLQDARGKKRRFKVIDETYRGKWAITNDTTYIRTGTKLHLLNEKKQKIASTTVGELLPLEEKILLRKGDRLIIHKKMIAGAPAEIHEDGRIKKDAHISCALHEIFTDTRVGEPILLDDGKIEGRIEEIYPDKLVVGITYADDKGSRLRADKGINLPESNLNLKGLTEKDKADLEFIARHADVVNVSFVNHPDDIEDIRDAIREVRGEHLGIILKIETKQGFRNLPAILIKAMQFHPIGVMIARGDLAVEIGWKKLAEVQEEILRLCTAAHIPDIWATQVLETLAKKGRPSRAEITDAAMAQRAECVMLNKGPHIVEAIQMLDDIIRLMQKSQRRKKPITPHFDFPQINFDAGTRIKIDQK